jgi:hypothetical protein
MAICGLLETVLESFLSGITDHVCPRFVLYTEAEIEDEG